MPKQQEVLEGTEGEGVRLQTSFGGMQIIASKEPKLRDHVYLVIGGHISQVKESSSDDDEKVIVTVVGQGNVITKDQYHAMLNGRPAPMWDDDGKPVEGDDE